MLTEISLTSVPPQVFLNRYERYQRSYQKTDAGRATSRRCYEKRYYPKTCSDCGSEAIYNDDRKIQSWRKLLSNDREIQNGRIIHNPSRNPERRFFVCNEC